MKKILIEGYIAPTEDQWMYDWMEYPVSTPKSLRDQLISANGDEVELWVNCYGGDVWAAVNMYDQLQTYSGKVTSIISGLSASASTIVMLGADVVKASVASQFMIHNAQTSAFGDYRDLESGAQLAKTSTDNIKAIYVKKTGMAYDELTALMDAETWFTAKEAVDIGLIDEIIDFSDQRFVANPLDDKARARFEQKKAEAIAKMKLEKERYRYE